LWEANLQGIPVIASDIASIRESVTLVSTEFFCDPAQSETFHLPLMALPSWTIQIWLKKLGLQGKARVIQDYSWNTIADQTIALTSKLPVNESAVKK